jgi:hypothetical protein
MVSREDDVNWEGSGEGVARCEEDVKLDVLEEAYRIVLGAR